MTVTFPLTISFDVVVEGFLQTFHYIFVVIDLLPHLIIFALEFVLHSLNKLSSFTWLFVIIISRSIDDYFGLIVMIFI